ncbi:GNAT family N-acetyltransferase [Kitasatospora sp. NBC_01560]|uniref:GNAT family N-acetyltransferase n=1 Tax=Kitasatospora sp. NBC_01560 TaxID=2975965 RepID=UPI00386EAF9C
MAATEADWEFGRDIDGLPVVRYVRGEREGRPWAERLTAAGADGAGGAAVSTTDPVEFVLSSMAGWVVSAPVDLGRRLLDHGATELRHGHTMYRDLAGDPPPPGWDAWERTALREGYRAVPCDRDAEELVPACLSAYGAGHPDRYPEDDELIRERLDVLLSGRAIGPVLPASSLVVDADDQVVGGLVLTDHRGTPWIANVFRHSEHGYPGLGRDLLHRTLGDLAGHGSARVGLAVTEGNPARRLYEALGFRLHHSTLSVIVP